MYALQFLPVLILVIQTPLSTVSQECHLFQLRIHNIRMKLFLNPKKILFTHNSNLNLEVIYTWLFLIKLSANIRVFLLEKSHILYIIGNTAILTFSVLQHKNKYFDKS